MIDESTGLLTTTEPLDREVKDIHTLFAGHITVHVCQRLNPHDPLDILRDRGTY